LPLLRDVFRRRPRYNEGVGTKPRIHTGSHQMTSLLDQIDPFYILEQTMNN